MSPEKILQDKHYLELLKGAAEIRRNFALNELQTSKTYYDRAFFSEEFEVFSAVLVLLEQRDKLQKYVSLLVKTKGEADTVTAAKLYLDEIGIDL